MDKVIIYDDDKDILLVTSVVLKMEGYELLCKEDCKTLREDLETFQPQVILMDNWLPDISGVKAIQFIKSQPAFQHIPVIFFSANSNVEELAKEAGSDYLLKKPFDMAALQNMVAQALKGVQTA